MSENEADKLKIYVSAIHEYIDERLKTLIHVNGADPYNPKIDSPIVADREVAAIYEELQSMCRFFAILQEKAGLNISRKISNTQPK